MILGDMAARMEQDSAALRLRLQVLTRQISTGQRFEAIGDMAPQLTTAVTLRTEIARRDTYAAALTQAAERARVSQTVLTRLREIGREFAEQVAGSLDPDRPALLPAMAGRARQALLEVGQLLNTRSKGEYLFGGSDLENPPIPDAQGLAEGDWATRIAAAVAGLGGGNAAAVAAATLAVVQDDGAGATPFSAFVSDPAGGLAEARRSVPAADGTVIGYGLFANRNAAVPSSGETAGGWARDLMRGLMSLAALTPAQAADRMDFRAFAGILRDGLRSATDALGDEAGALGQTQARLEAARLRHDEIGVALAAQLSSIQDTDMARAVSLSQQTRTQLEASYAATARILGLSLAQFIR